MSRPRTVTVRYTVAVQFEVPDDFPLTAEEVQKTVDWKANDFRDGRMPFTTETMVHAASRAGAWHLDEAVFQHYCRRIEAAFGSSNDHLAARDRLVARCCGSVRRLPVHEVEVSVSDYVRSVDCPGCGQPTLVSRYKECVCGATLPVEKASLRDVAP